MIISHKYKFIFIKTLKTAGTSIEVEMSKILGDNDVATPILPFVEGHVAKNYKYREYGVLPKELYNHMSALEVKKRVGRRVFNNYFKFCVEREPIDKCISHYSMLKNSPDHNRDTQDMMFDEYVLKKEFPIDFEKYTDKNNTLMVDKIIRYENLKDGLSAIGSMLGFNLTINARAKSGYREGIQATDEQKRIIYSAFEKSNLLTGYTLEG